MMLMEGWRERERERKGVYGERAGGFFFVVCCEC